MEVAVETKDAGVTEVTVDFNLTPDLLFDLSLL